MRLTPATALVLRALLDGRQHGFDIMAATSLASGTVYPILRRLEAEGVARGKWEGVTAARDSQRPPRRYYELSSGGVRVARAITAATESPRLVRAVRPVEG